MIGTEVAERLAKMAHRDQRDKAGYRYIDHPRRVAQHVAQVTAGLTPSERITLVLAAWLHDVVEDTPYTLSDLAGYGIPEPVLDVIDLLTRRPGQTADTYYRRIAEHPLARIVKLADIDDNADPTRLALLGRDLAERLETKYRHARHLIDLYTPPGIQPGTAGEWGRGRP